MSEIEPPTVVRRSPSSTERRDASSSWPSTHPALLVSLTMIWAMVLALNAPGHMSYDSIVQLAEGRSGIADGMHPPLMSALLGVFDAIVPGTALYMTLVSSAFLGAMLLAVRGTGRPILSCVVALCVFALPVLSVYQGIIWKDVLFANMALLSFMLLTVVPRYRGRFYIAGLVAGASLLLSAALLSRQNGLVLLPFFSFAVYLAVRAAGRLRAATIAASSAVGTMTLVALLSLATANLIEQQSEGVIGSGVRVLAQYDIAGITARSPAATASFGEGAEGADLSYDLQAHYTAERLDYLSSSEFYNKHLLAISSEEIRALWWNLVTNYPVEYAQHRLSVLRWMLWAPEPQRCLPVHVGVEGPPNLILQLGLQHGSRASDQTLYAYAATFNKTPFVLPGMYILAAVILIGLLFRRGRQQDLIIAVLLSSGVIFSLSYVILGIACDLRYNYFIIISTIIALLFYISSLHNGVSPDSSHS